MTCVGYTSRTPPCTLVGCVGYSAYVPYRGRRTYPAVVVYVTCVGHDVGMPTLTIAARKGGVGKTQTAVSLAGILGRTHPTLLIDADPQGSALHWSERAADRGGLGCTTIALPVRDLHRRVDDVAGGFAWVVIDTPPGKGDVAIARSGLLAADIVIMPLGPTLIDQAEFRSTLDLVAETEPREGRPWGVLLTRVRTGTISARESRAALERMGVPVLESEIPLRETIALAYGWPVLGDEYDPVAAEVLVMAGGK